MRNVEELRSTVTICPTAEGDDEEVDIDVEPEPMPAREADDEAWLETGVNDGLEGIE